MSLSESFIRRVSKRAWGISIEIQLSISFRLGHTKLWTSRLNRTISVFRVVKTSIWGVLSSLGSQISSPAWHGVHWTTRFVSDDNLWLVIAWAWDSSLTFET